MQYFQSTAFSSLLAHFFGLRLLLLSFRAVLFVLAVVFVELHAHTQRDKYLFKTYARGLSLLCTVKIYISLFYSRSPFSPVPWFLFSAFCVGRFLVLVTFLRCANVRNTTGARKLAD